MGYVHDGYLDQFPWTSNDLGPGYINDKTSVHLMYLTPSKVLCWVKLALTWNDNVTFSKQTKETNQKGCPQDNIFNFVWGCRV